MRRLTLLILLLASLPSVASAQVGINESIEIEFTVAPDAGGTGLSIAAVGTFEIPGQPAPTQPPASAPERDPELARYDFTLPDGRICIRYLPVLPFIPAPLTLDECDQIVGDPITPIQWVTDYLDNYGPEPPQPSFIPPFGLTGEPMYLRTVAPVDWSHQQDDTPFGPVTIDGTAIITVDWGDTTDPTTHTVTGQAWPDGQITHVWQDTGTYDITVTYQWTFDWTFLDSNGTVIRTLTETIDDYPVHQAQPVIRRP